MNRALIVRLGSLGDIVHAMPVAAALRTAFPAARIDWATHPAYVPLVGLVQGVDAAIPVDTRAWQPGSRGNLFAGLSSLRQAAYDIALDLQGLIKSAVLARAAGAGRTIGFARAHLREPAARFFYDETVDPGDAVHVIQQNLALSTHVGADGQTVRFPLAVPASAAARQAAGEAGAGGFALLNPGAAWPNKRWPADRFGALADGLRRQHGLASVVLWGPGEKPLAEAVVAASQGAARLAPPTTIADMVAVAGAARLMVSGDTGPLHLAAAVGTPVVALFGPTRTERNGPWAGQDISLSRTAACECLYERRCRRARPCIEEIDVDDVLAAVTRRLGGRV